MGFKSGFVAIIGRPNACKSTLLNKILGQKVVITSDKVQTTRRRIRGIYNSEKGQIVFVDTPGVHKPLHKLGEFLLEEVKFAIPDADLVLFVVDGTEIAGAGDKWIVENLLNQNIPIILTVNKVDMIKSMEKREENINSYKELFAGKIPPIAKISAKTGRNIDDFMKIIFRKLPNGPKYYPDEEITDQNMRSICSELIREKVLISTHEEIPQSVAVVVDKYEESEKITRISATIFVEQESQKGILIGEAGKMIKKIGTEARREMEKIIETKVFLDLYVKVRKDWRKKDPHLKDLGYFNP